MANYAFPPKDKTLYGLTTGTVYTPRDSDVLPWESGGLVFDFNGISAIEPDGVTDVRPTQVGDTLSTVEELDALPSGTILRDESGALEKSKRYFFSAGGRSGFSSAQLADGVNTLTILWLP